MADIKSNIPNFCHSHLKGIFYLNPILMML